MPEYLKKAARTSTDDSGDVRATVQAILDEIEAGGEASAREYAAKFDKYDGNIVLTRDEIRQHVVRVLKQDNDSSNNTGNLDPFRWRRSLRWPAGGRPS